VTTSLSFSSQARKGIFRMDERLNLTFRQLRLIQKINSHNECRISHIASRNSAIVIVRDQERRQYAVLKIARRGKVDLLSAYAESDLALEVFQQMRSVGDYKTFKDLFKLAQVSKTLTDADMAHLSSEELISLCNLALDELARRPKTEGFVMDKMAHGKELLEACVGRTIEALRRAFDDALEETGLMSNQNQQTPRSKSSLREKNESPRPRSFASNIL